VRLCLRFHRGPSTYVSEMLQGACGIYGCVSYGVRDHGGEEWAGGIVGVELAHKEGDHGDLDEEDDGVE
jgi:hypothetical protein